MAAVTSSSRAERQQILINAPTDGRERPLALPACVQYLSHTTRLYITRRIRLADINPPDITPLVRTPCRIRTQCTISFYVTEKGVLKAKFQDWRT